MGVKSDVDLPEIKSLCTCVGQFCPDSRDFSCKDSKDLGFSNILLVEVSKTQQAAQSNLC